MEHARPPTELCLEGGPASRAESWRKWHTQFCVFLKASGVYKEPQDVQASLLINLIGPEGYDVYTTFKFTADEKKDSLDTVVKKFNEHFGTKQNTTMSRFKFFTRNQERGESIDEYVTALKLLTQYCEFEHLEESLVRDRIVCGVSDGKLRDRLLRADTFSCISTISEERKRNQSKWYETLFLSLNGKSVVFKLDSGSDLNVISLKTFINLGFSQRILRSDATKAQSFCGSYIPIAGSTDIEWVYKNKTYMLHFVVADLDCQNVLGRFACEEMGMIRRVLSVNIDVYKDLFQGLGKLPGKYNIVIDKHVQPSVCPVRKIPMGVRDNLLQELNRMERMGVVRKVSHPTPWVNAIVVAPKKDGSLRVCLDPRPLNRAVRRAHYPLPTLAEIAARLEGATVFSKLDTRSGFWMVQLDDASADLCTFGTPFGRYQFLRLPYGINCASEVFHSKIRQLLEDLEGVDSFVDDVIVWGSSRAQHDERLAKLMDRAREVGIKFNREKCEFQVSQVIYLGHTFSERGMAIDRNKIKAIEKMPDPEDRPSLERFLGMINYLSKFIPNYSDTAAPLRSLLKKESEWVWDEPQRAAARALRGAVCAAPVLALYSPRAPCLLTVDASSRALGAALLQAGRPVEFASATLTDTQGRYAQIEKELLAIVFALERFHQYVYGRRDVTVETDHKPLEALFKKSLDSIPARLQRMMLRIQRYDFNVVYKPGKYLFVADALSRAALPDTMPGEIERELDEQSGFLIENVRFSGDRLKVIKDALGEDEECQLIIRYVKEGWPMSKYEVDDRARGLWPYKDSFEYVDGIIFKDNLVYVPVAVRREMLRRVHEGHMGMDRCKRHAREVMFWPGMSRDIEALVRRCAACAERAPRPAREPLLPHAVPRLPWQKLGSDIFQHAGKYFVILVDYFSNFIEVNPLTNIGSKAVMTAMKDQFARHGIPQELVTDNGPAYSSKIFAEFSRQWGFRHTTTSPNFCQSNGLSERSVQTVKNILIKSIASGGDFYLGLLNHRTTPREGVGSPAELLMSRRLDTLLPVHSDKLKPSRNNDEDYANIMLARAATKAHYDTRARALPELAPGQPVLMADEGRRRRARVLHRAPQPRSYFVTDDSGRRYRRNRRHLIKLEDVTPEEPGTPGNGTDDDELWASPNIDVKSNGVDIDDDVNHETPGSEPAPSEPHAPHTPHVTTGRRPAASMARHKINQAYSKQK